MKTWVKIHGINMYLDPSERIQHDMINLYYEPDETQWVKDCLKPGDTFVDIGANFGWFTALATTIVGPTGKVFGFEPSPIAFATLQIPYATNQFPQTRLYNSAVGDNSGWVYLQMPVEDGIHSPSVFNHPGEFYPFKVPIISLDYHNEIQKIDSIDLIKIDVEGYEPNTVAGMQWLAKSGRIKRISVEFNEWWLDANNTIPKSYLGSVGQLEKDFADLGFVEEKSIPWGVSGPTGDYKRIRNVLYKHISVN